MTNNPIKIFDDLVMRGVTKGVRAVNRFTGLTRTEQAQISCATGYITRCTYEFANGRSSMGGFYLGFGALMFVVHGIHSVLRKENLKLLKTAPKFLKIL